ncbi:MAG: metallophosphoesterase [Oscillospiraceae bacterium]|nr:metallophosphoesterase [Oscillospiraceae bacterium]
MKLLLLADRECPALWDFYRPGCLDEYDLILACGDLNSSYLSFLVTLAHCPVLYVHGNHDGAYASRPPEGCDCIEDQVVTCKGLRILGLGGAPLYNGGPHQYTEAQMARRIRRLRWKLRKGVDIVVTHAPAEGYGDGQDYAHRGFACLVDLMDRYQPKYLIHGHMHVNYGSVPRLHRRGGTAIINAYERYVIEL